MKCWLQILVLLLAVTACADKVFLTDGTVVVGNVEKKQFGKVTISSVHLGTVTIDEDAISLMEIDHPMKVADQKKKVEEIDKVSIVSEMGDVSVDTYSRIYTQKDIVAMWLPDATDLTLPPPRKWSGEIFADMTARSGNTHKFRGGTGGKVAFTGPVDRLSINALALYERENGNTSTHEYNGVIDYEHQIRSRGSWYVKGEAEQDKIEKLDLRWLCAGGLGYHFIMTPHCIFRLRGGMAYQEKKYKNHHDDDSNMGAEINLHFEYKVDCIGKLTSDLTYTPIFTSHKNYDFVHETALDVPLMFKMPLSLRLGIRNEYDGMPPENTKRWDTIYFARIVYKW